MVGLARRKISSSGKNYVELGEPSAPAVDVENSGASDQTNEEQKDNSRSITGCILTVLIVLLLLVDGYWFATPEATKVEHIRILNKQLVEYSDSFDEVKEALYKQIGYYTSQIEEEKEAIEEEKEAKEDDGLVKLKAENEQLRKEKDAALNKMEEELKALKEQLSRMTFDKSSFCADCKMEKMGATCGGRKDYLMRVHGDSEDKAMQAVMSFDFSCVSKQK
mmetsp:Transcript_56485/g.83975  ORF Transcript_56485/g.83975 Transcript_56485/m.83975 type:complete len:221 (-) Transcript_56485:1196-1858(-)